MVFHVNLARALARAVLGAIAVVLIVHSGNARASDRLLPFQGHLTDAAGQLLNGTRLVQFKLYDAPVGGKAKWAGEVHNLTVNGGLVNTVLGTKSSLNGVDFSLTLYLEITVDANMDKRIDSADPPLLPRQVLLAALYSRDSGLARNSMALRGIPAERILTPSGLLNGDAISYQKDSILADLVDKKGVHSKWIPAGSILESQLLGVHRLISPSDESPELEPGENVGIWVNQNRTVVVESNLAVRPTETPVRISENYAGVYVDVVSGNLMYVRASVDSEGSSSETTRAELSQVISPEIAEVFEKVDNVKDGGGPAKLDDWQTRKLTNILPEGGTFSINLDAARDVITLKKGGYWIEGSVPAYKVDGHVATLDRVGANTGTGPTESDPQAVLYGTGEWASDANSVQTRSFISGYVQVDKEEEQFVIRHHTRRSSGAFGLGIGHNTNREINVPFITTRMTIRRIR